MLSKKNIPPVFSRHPLRQRKVNYPTRHSSVVYRKSILKVSTLLKSISPTFGRKGGGDYEGSAKLIIGYVISSANRFCCYKSE